MGCGAKLNRYTGVAVALKARLADIDFVDSWRQLREAKCPFRIRRGVAYLMCVDFACAYSSTRYSAARRVIDESLVRSTHKRGLCARRRRDKQDVQDDTRFIENLHLRLCHPLVEDSSDGPTL